MPEMTAPALAPPTAPAPPSRLSALPGLVLSLAAGTAAVLLSRAVPAASAALVAILLGAAAANLGLLGARLRPGLDVSARTVLRLGIVLLGLQLSLGQVIALGPATLVLIVVIVGGGIGAGLLLGRLLRVPFPLTVLISCGFSICGAAAVAAVSAPLAAQTSAEEDGVDPDEVLGADTPTAIALVVVFGTIMIPVISLLSHLMGLDAAAAGTWAGASIHEVAQVVAAASLLGGESLDIAVLVKLGRVLMLAPVVTILMLSLRRRARTRAAIRGGAGPLAPTSDGTRAAMPPLVPGFVIGFAVAAAIRTVGILPQQVLDASQLLQSVLLASAMFALGTGVRVSMLRTVGGRPLVLALLLTIVVAALGLGGAVIARG